MFFPKIKYVLWIFIFTIIACQNQEANQKKAANQNIDKPKLESPKATETFTSLLGKKLTVAEPSPKMLAQLEKAKQDFSKNEKDVENIIWLGRRTAYLGRYQEAIDIFTKGIAQHPNDARLYRHRGHRFISIRKFDEAIQDFEKAVTLIDGKENEIEPDGMPNALNIPISTLHGNIWYHLGLAYYLKHDFKNAFRAYQKCRQVGNNDDNIVSSTHWLYMIQRRMNNEALAKKQLEPIEADMKIIENHSYYNLCKFYNDMIPRDSLLNTDGSPAGDAVKYGLANWDFYQGDGESAKQQLEEILEGKSWSSFGYIAAEVDYLKFYKNE